MPVCEPGSLPGFVDIVTTVAGRGSPAEWTQKLGALRDPLPRRLTASTASPGASSLLVSSSAAR